MTHFIDDYLSTQLIWTGFLALTILSVKSFNLNSTDAKYRFIKYAFMSFPFILMIKFMHLELPFSFTQSELINNIGDQAVPVEQTINYGPFLVSIFGILLFYKMFTYWMSHKHKKSIKPVKNDPIENILIELKTHLNMTQTSIQIMVDDYVGSPYCYGVKSYKIILPKTFIKTESLDSIRAILLHELNHIKHKDTDHLVLEEAIHVMSLINPFAWIGRRLLNNYREQRCDHSVLQTNLITIKDYAKTLLDIKLKTQQRYWPIPVAQLTTQSSILERRIKSMKNLSKKDSKIKIGFLSISLISLLVFISCENKTEVNQPAEVEVVTEQPHKVDFSTMSKDEIKDYKMKLAKEKELELNQKNGNAYYELKDDAQNLKFGDLKLIPKDGKNQFTLRDDNGDLHEVKIDKDSKANIAFKANVKVQKALKELIEKEKNVNHQTFTFREVKPDASPEKKKKAQLTEILEKVKKQD